MPGYMWNIIISKLFQPLSTSTWNNFISVHGNLPEIISNLLQRIIAAHEYFPICSMSLKYSRNNSRTLSAAEIILFQFQSWLHVKQNTEIISKLFSFTCNHSLTVCMSVPRSISGMDFAHAICAYSSKITTYWLKNGSFLSAHNV